jgi:acyl dehydratase
VIEVDDIASLDRRLGEEIAVSDWIAITQERIDSFADATEDRQWIHVDPARAADESPFKTTVAHGFLTLSLASALIRQSIRLPGARMAINYGMNRVRFPSPVPAGSHVRGRFSPVAVDRRHDAVDVTWSVTLERQGATKPCCVAEWLVRYYVSDHESRPV